MSRSAGRVLIIPKGEYSANTQYYMLDLVEYNGCGYVAKQETKGNLPTDTTYWQQMGSTGGGIDPSLLMLVDGSNAEIVKFTSNQTHNIEHVNISKTAGENQTVNMTVYVKYDSTKGKLTTLIREELEAHVGDENIYFFAGDDKVYVIIDSIGSTSKSYDTNDDTISVRAHLKDDVSDAMSYSDKYLVISSYISSSVGRGLLLGAGNTLANNLSFAGGRSSAAATRAFSFGDRCVAGDYGHAEGLENVAVNRGHAEGRYTVSGAEGAHAEGTGTIAQYTNQHAQGKWNYPRSNVLFMIGNGTPDARSNCFEIYNDGSISFDNGASKYKFAIVDGVNGFYDKNNVFHPIESTVLTNSNVTLSTSDITTVTFSDSAIKADSRLQVFTDVFGIDPIDIRASVGTCSIDFAQVESSTTINVQLEIR